MIATGVQYSVRQFVQFVCNDLGIEPTNRHCALAKIASIEICLSHNRVYGTKYLTVVPNSLYGPGDNCRPESSYVTPALIRKFHEAKEAKASFVTMWGTGTTRREFLCSEDMADACVFLTNLPDEKYDSLLDSDESKTGNVEPPLGNIGVSEGVASREPTATVKQVVGYDGGIVFDTTKPDGTPRKLMDVGKLTAMGSKTKISLTSGLSAAIEADSAKLAR